MVKIGRCIDFISMTMITHQARKEICDLIKKSCYAFLMALIVMASCYFLSFVMRVEVLFF